MKLTKVQTTRGTRCYHKGKRISLNSYNLLRDAFRLHNLTYAKIPGGWKYTATAYGK